MYVAITKTINNKYTKIVTTEHNTYNRRRDIKIMKILDYWMYSKYNGIIAITKSTKDHLNKYLPSTSARTIVIENGINMDNYIEAQPLPRGQLIKNITEGDIVVLMVAAFRNQKDHETVIKAVQLLPDNYHVVFVGDGERFEKVKEYAGLNKDNNNNVHFLGRRPDVARIMKSCDIFYFLLIGKVLV